ncbi:MAG: Hsp20/alpha crystallin family protein [Gemmatimonadales bacterium]|nr:Hsp20/alpha crystallin family protein [Gemmatimonadales bacterium]
MYRNTLLPFSARNPFAVEPLVDRLFGNGMEVPVRHSVDVEEHEDRAVVSLALPGVRPEELSITAEGRLVTVAVDQGERGRFRRQYTVGPKYDLAQIEARLELGMLTLVLPKAAEAQPRQIPVTIG